MEDRLAVVDEDHLQPEIVLFIKKVSSNGIMLIREKNYCNCERENPQILFWGIIKWKLITFYPGFFPDSLFFEVIHSNA